MPLSNNFRENILKVFASKASISSSYYLGLSTTAPNPDGTGVSEPEGNGYHRIDLDTVNIIGGVNSKNPFPNNPVYDSQNDKYSYSNSEAELVFPEATGNWGTITHFVIYNASTGGTMAAYGALTNSISPTAGSIPVIRAGDLVIEEQ